MRARFADYTIAISSTTSTGHALASARFGAENVFYFPLDLRFASGAYVRLLRPAAGGVAETEFWPNFLRAARRCGASVAVVNARISDRSLSALPPLLFPAAPGVAERGFVSWRRVKTDAERLTAIGAEGGRVQVAGNLKFDAARCYAQWRGAIAGPHP